MKTEKTCIRCGARYPDSEFFCPHDGSALRLIRGDHSDLIGQIVADRYRVIHKLGEGGMGDVYLAEHVRMGRKIALKVLKPAMVAEADAVGRFNREASNASKISHPNVATVYDFGETVDGVTFLAMEFVDGLPLTAVIEKSGALSPPRTANVVRQVADALTAAHELKIIHRDLKPDNIMIARGRDGSDVVKVVDFGIAKAAGGESQNVTRTGLIVGTPEYMSPEQLLGEGPDVRSDIYSLGLVAYYSLTGALPFPSTSAAGAMMMRLSTPPTPLSAASPDVVWPNHLQQVIDRALSRDASRRYQTAGEFAKALSESVSRMSVSAPDGAMGSGGVSGISRYLSSVSSFFRGRSASRLAVTPTPQTARSRRPVFVVGGLVAVSIVGGSAFWYEHLANTRVSGVPPESSLVVSLATKDGSLSTGTVVGGAVAVDSGRKKFTPASSGKIDLQVDGAPGRTGGSRFAFPAARITVRATNLSPGLLAAIQSMARRVPGVVFVDNASSPADLVVSGDSSGGTVVRGPLNPVPTKLDSATAPRTMLNLFRYRMSLVALQALDSVAHETRPELQVGNSRRAFVVGDTIGVRVRADRTGFLTLIDVDPSGTVTVLHPSADLDVGRVTAHQLVRFEKDWTAGYPIGDGAIRAIITDAPLGLKREGPVLVSPDGPSLAAAIRREIERITRVDRSSWSTVSIGYSIIIR